MPKLEEVYARKKEASSQVSTQTRTLAFGFLAIAWALLTVHDDPLKSMAANVSRYWILVLAAISVIVLALDMFQYVALTRMAESTYRKAEDAGQTENVVYDPESCAYKAQAFFYHAKFWVLGAGSIVLIIVFFLLFLPLKATPK
jgi:hypothetical protein